MDNLEEEFGEIIEIVVQNDEVYFYMKIYHEYTFYEHYHAYLVVRNDHECKKYKLSDLPIIAPCLSVIINNQHFIASRYIL